MYAYRLLFGLTSISNRELKAKSLTGRTYLTSLAASQIEN